ncbi:MAG: hypothetical protein M1812_001241 [Candelaria pacifica]|nr:MAG: hypothetical protein M1812_001241 [Candelaria pacifica]
MLSHRTERTQASEPPAAGYQNYNLACSKRCLRSLKYGSILSRDYHKGIAPPPESINPKCHSCYRTLIQVWAREIQYREAPVFSRKTSDDEKKLARARLEDCKKDRERDLRAFDPGAEGVRGPRRKSSMRVNAARSARGKSVRFENEE